MPVPATLVRPFDQYEAFQCQAPTGGVIINGHLQIYSHAKVGTMKRISTALAISGILATAVPSAAVAQYMPPYTAPSMPQYMPVSPVPPIDPMFQRNIPPPMDMTWGIESQIELWRKGQLTVQAAFNLCLQLSQMVRQSGGDPGNCGATQQSLQASITALSQQFERNNRAAATNSQITNDAIQRTCSRYWVPAEGRYVVYCP